MRKQYISQTVTFRFRRWSRKGYAAFISIHRSVSIGQLACHLAERFYSKSTSTQPGPAVPGNDGDEDDGEQVNLSVTAVNAISNLLALVLLPLLLPQNAAIAYPAGQPFFTNKPDSGKYLLTRVLPAIFLYNPYTDDHNTERICH
ncbi:MAG: hypothetical protein LUD74_04595 [Tannerellaceae bacterium]|nr:hypothetical protein [Tannerellaceae bacterium]